jgi:hypothetical protein
LSGHDPRRNAAKPFKIARFVQPHDPDSTAVLSVGLRIIAQIIGDKDES